METNWSQKGSLKAPSRNIKENEINGGWNRETEIRKLRQCRRRSKQHRDWREYSSNKALHEETHILIGFSNLY